MTDEKVGKLIFATGYQRSGTSALLLGFLAGNDPSIVFEESPDSALFVNKNFVKPPQVREAMARLGPVLIAKPNKLFGMLPMRRIAHLYRSFDLRIVWSVRDPVDVYASKWVQNHRRNILGHPAEGLDPVIMDKMTDRLDRVLEALEEKLLNVLVVRYQDLMQPTDLPETIRAFTGVGFDCQHEAQPINKAAALSEAVKAEVRAVAGGRYDAVCGHAVRARPLAPKPAA